MYGINRQYLCSDTTRIIRSAITMATITVVTLMEVFKGM